MACLGASEEFLEVDRTLGSDLVSVEAFEGFEVQRDQRVVLADCITDGPDSLFCKVVRAEVCMDDVPVEEKDF
jgi:hypothetical protein